MKIEIYEVEMLFSGDYSDMVEFLATMHKSIKAGEPKPKYVKLNPSEGCCQIEFHVEAISKDKAVERITETINPDWFDQFDLDFDGWA